MWENSSAYSRVRFEDIATITTNNTQINKKALNNPVTSTTTLQHQPTPKFQSQLTPTSTKRQLKANYNTIEKLTLGLMETLQ